MAILGAALILILSEDARKVVLDKLFGAEEHFRKGEMALRREQFVQAEKEFRAALELNELEPDHHALLAWAKWCAASDRDAVDPRSVLPRVIVQEAHGLQA